ncbi:MAG: hypothetical protein M3Z95_00115 [Actinomycetota bacterium]|nr:hypothetical protein [Actinomycetota bacterium]
MRNGFRFSLGLAWLLLAASLPSAASAGAGSPVTVYESATTGTASRSEAASTPALGTGLQASEPSRGVRPIPRAPAPAQPAGPAPIGPPQASSAALLGTSSALLESFNGVSSRDSAVTNFGAQFEPPDPGMCVGNGFVVEMVNSAYTVYRPNGTVVTGPFNINGPFGEGLAEFTSDPRCHYDAATHTWFAIILFINRESTASSLDIAVNTSGDPTKLWTDYKINTTDLGGKTGPKHAGCPCFGDQPLLGIDAYNLYVSTNNFSILGPQFNGAQIFAIAKKDLVSLAPQPHYALFDNLNIGGAPAATVQPALSSGTPAAEFFLNSIDPNETFDQRMGVWAMTNRAVVATGGTPQLSSVVVPTEAFGVPPQAEQKGTSSLLNPGDDRMQQVQFIGGSVWGALDTALTIPGDPVKRAGAAWFQVQPALGAGAITSAHIRRQGYVALTGSYLLYPALQASAKGGAAMVMTLSSSKRFPSAAFSTLEPGASSFGPVEIGAAGSTNYDPGAGRWGDYSWAVLDPAGKSVWMATEYMPPKPSQTTDGRRDWGTRVLQVGLPGG